MVISVSALVSRKPAAGFSAYGGMIKGGRECPPSPYCFTFTYTDSFPPSVAFHPVYSE